MAMQNQNDISKVDMGEKATTDAQSDLGVGKMLTVDDNVLLAQGHRPVLKRTFDLFGTIGLGFRSTPPYLPTVSRVTG